MSFRFSQHSLQDYVDCQRRFQLRYALMQPWPSLVTESPTEAELHLQRGADLHHLALQHALGLDPGRLAGTIHDATLARWWRTFLDRPPRDLPQTVRRAEVELDAPVAGQRLLARFDLFAVDTGRRAVIVDWKTPSKRPARRRLAQRLQTRVYQFLAVEAGACYNGGQRLEPEQVEMIYWLAEFHGDTERFRYDSAQYETDKLYLASLISEIQGHQEPIWPLTLDERQCLFCNYRSLCERGVKAGLLADLEDDLEPAMPEIELEQIGEIAF